MRTFIFFAPPSELCRFSFSPRESIRAAQTPSLPTLQGNVCQKKGRGRERGERGGKTLVFNEIRLALEKFSVRSSRLTSV